MPDGTSIVHIVILSAFIYRYSKIIHFKEMAYGYPIYFIIYAIQCSEKDFVNFQNGIRPFGSHFEDLQSHFPRVGSRFVNLQNHFLRVGSHFVNLQSHFRPSGSHFESLQNLFRRLECANKRRQKSPHVAGSSFGQREIVISWLPSWLVWLLSWLPSPNAWLRFLFAWL